MSSSDCLADQIDKLLGSVRDLAYKHTWVLAFAPGPSNTNAPGVGVSKKVGCSELKELPRTRDPEEGS